jgi:hypothetical protein
MQNASEIENLKGKTHCSQLTATAQLRNSGPRPATPPAWVRGPTADGWAGEAAQRRLPPGLKVARPAA